MMSLVTASGFSAAAQLVFGDSEFREALHEDEFQKPQTL